MNVKELTIQLIALVILIICFISLCYFYNKEVEINKLLDINYCVSESSKFFSQKSNEELKDLCIEGYMNYFNNTYTGDTK